MAIIKYLRNRKRFATETSTPMATTLFKEYSSEKLGKSIKKHNFLRQIDVFIVLSRN